MSMQRASFYVGWVKPRKRRTQQNHTGLCRPTLKGDTLRLIHSAVCHAGGGTE